MLSKKILVDVDTEALRGYCIHGPDEWSGSRERGHLEKLPILMEEVGEVANALTYDGPRDSAAVLRDELIQVAAVAAAWADSIKIHHEEEETP